jgi:AraC-like DNA-binding protein
MPEKTTTGHFYKHEEFMLMKEIDFKSAFTGFGINTNARAINNPRIEDNFRTDFLCIFLQKEGHSNIRLNMKDFAVNKNDLLLITPHVMKQFLDADEKAVVSVLTFTPDFLVKVGLPDNMMEIMNYFGSQYSPHWSLSQQDAQRMFFLFEQLEQRASELATHPYGKELLHHSFFIVLYELAALGTKYAKMIQEQTPRKEALTISFTNLVQLHFIKHRNVKYYADLLYITPKYLTETVKEVMGKSAGEVIDHFVMLEAKLLLENPKLSIAQIASALNFSDQSFFGKYFKRHAALSPKEFRAANNVMSR